MSTTETRDSVSSADDEQNPPTERSSRPASQCCPARRQPVPAELVDVAAFCRAKCKEWLSCGAYPMAEKLAKFSIDPAMQRTAATAACCFSFSPADLQSVWCFQFARALSLLGWTAADRALEEEKAPAVICSSDGTQSPPLLPPPLIVGPEVASAMRQRSDFSQHAARVASWDCPRDDAPGVGGGAAAYWKLYEKLEAFERSLQQLAGMGLLQGVDSGESEQRRRKQRRVGGVGEGRHQTAGSRRSIESADFMLPTLHLGEVWGRRLAMFLKAQGDCCFHLRPEQPTTPLATSSVIYKPEPDQNSGRRRLEALEAIRQENFGGGDGRQDTTAGWDGRQLLLLQAWPNESERMRLTDRDFTLETYLLMAPRRNWLNFGCAAFFHHGLVRLGAPSQPAQQASSSSASSSTSAIAAAEAAASSTTGPSNTCWLPEQLFDYLSAAEPRTAAWFRMSIYPQMEAVAAYLALVLSQHLLDSSHAQFRLIRLSFIVLQSGLPPSSPAADSDSPEGGFGRVGRSPTSTRLAGSRVPSSTSLHVRLVDVGHCGGGGGGVGSNSSSGNGNSDGSRSEALTLTRIAQECGMIVAELLVRSSGRLRLDDCGVGAAAAGTAENYPARRLVAPHNMKPVFDSVDPALQRAVLDAALN